MWKKLTPPLRALQKAFENIVYYTTVPVTPVS
jgi:hypothetical protein